MRSIAAGALACAAVLAFGGGSMAAPARPDWKGIWHPAERNMFDPTAFELPQNKGKAVELWRKAAAGATSPPRRSCAS